jgi:hypothetical protein
MRRLALALALCALAVPALAQQQNIQVGQLAYLYDLDSTSTTYCRLVGSRSDPYGPAISGSGTVSSPGNDTLTASATNGFGQLAAGDAITVLEADGVRTDAIVLTKNSSTEVVLNLEILNCTGGCNWTWRDLQCGTGAEDGWVEAPPGQHASILMTVQYEVGDLGGGLDVVYECRGANLGAAPVQVYPGGGSDCGGFATLNTDVCTIATADAGTVKGRLAYQLDPVNFQECRVGIKANTSDSDPTVEQITMTVTTVR